MRVFFNGAPLNIEEGFSRLESDRRYNATLKPIKGPEEKLVGFERVKLVEHINYFRDETDGEIEIEDFSGDGESYRRLNEKSQVVGVH
ncbi:MAG: hypothetical protein ABIG37_02530 [Nanoarchaeota archaeon]